MTKKPRKKSKKTPPASSSIDAKKSNKKYDNNAPTFIGLDEILWCLVKHTHKRYTGKKDLQGRFDQIKHSLLLGESGGNVGRPDNDNEMSFFIAVAKSVTRERNTKIESLKNIIDTIPSEKRATAIRKANKIKIAPHVREHIHLISDQKHGKEKLITNWVTNYNQRGVLYENEKFLSDYDKKRKVADEITRKALIKASAEHKAATNEIKECLKKYNWPF